MKRHFWLNGHECEIRTVGREQYEAYLDGERFTDFGDMSMEDALAYEAKYLTEGSHDTENMFHAILDFIEGVERSRDCEWVMWKSLQDNLLGDGYLAHDYSELYNAVWMLSEGDFLEKKKVHDGLNPVDMFRRTEDAKELSESSE